MRKKTLDTPPEDGGSTVVVDGLAVMWEEVLAFGRSKVCSRLRAEQLKQPSAWRNGELF